MHNKRTRRISSWSSQVFSYCASRSLRLGVPSRALQPICRRKDARCTTQRGRKNKTCMCPPQKTCTQWCRTTASSACGTHQLVIAGLLDHRARHVRGRAGAVHLGSRRRDQRGGTDCEAHHGYFGGGRGAAKKVGGAGSGRWMSARKRIRATPRHKCHVLLVQRHKFITQSTTFLPLLLVQKPRVSRPPFPPEICSHHNTHNQQLTAIYRCTGRCYRYADGTATTPVLEWYVHVFREPTTDQSPAVVNTPTQSRGSLR
jgi:hypothetical protein